MKLLSKMNKVVGLTILMFMVTSISKADEAIDNASTRYKDCSIKLSSPSSARGTVYVGLPNSSRKKKNNPTSHTGPAQTSILKANFDGTWGYHCYLYAYPKAGYVLDGFVKSSDYLANRTSSNYFLKDEKGKIIKSGGYFRFSEIGSSDSETDPTISSSYVFSAKESFEYYAIFRTAISQTIIVDVPGTLKKAVLNSSNNTKIDNLIVKGKIDKSDMFYLKTMIDDYNLVRIDLTDAVIETIPYMVFYDCASLYEVKLPTKGLFEIENDAFRGCRSLISCPIPSSVKKIGDRVFQDCHSLDFFK